MKRVFKPANDLASAGLPLNVALCTSLVSAALVAELTGWTEDDARRAIAGWLRAGHLVAAGSAGTPARVRAKTRAAAQRAATPRQCRRAYDSLARAFDAGEMTATVALEVARYYRGAARARSAMARYLAVAEGRLACGDYVAADAVLREMSATVAVTGPETHAVFELRFRTAVALDDIEAARTALDRMRRAAVACGDRFAVRHALLAGADLDLAAERVDRAADAASEVIALCATEPGHSPDLAVALLIESEAAAESGRSAYAAQRFTDALALDAHADAAILSRVRRVNGKLRCATDTARAELDFRAALAAAGRACDDHAALAAARCLAAAQRENTDLYAASAGLREALRTAGRRGLSAPARPLVADLAGLYLDAGRYADARRLMMPAIVARAPAVALRVSLHGDDELIEAGAVTDALEDALGSRHARRIAALVPVCAALARRRGEAAEAHALYRRAVGTIGDSTGALEFWCDAAQFAAAAETAAIGAAVDAARPGASPLGRLLAEFAGIALDRRSPAASAGLSCRIDTLAATFLGAGFRDWAHRTRLLALDSPSPERSATILHLLASGRSNAAIAMSLGVSKRSVDGAIRTLLRNHAVRYRWQLIERTRQAGRPRSTDPNVENDAGRRRL